VGGTTETVAEEVLEVSSVDTLDRRTVNSREGRLREQLCSFASWACFLRDERARLGTRPLSAIALLRVAAVALSIFWMGLKVLIFDGKTKTKNN
jgi:hypothetical protein